jgi:hypothetical protein
MKKTGNTRAALLPTDVPTHEAVEVPRLIMWQEIKSEAQASCCAIDQVIGN